MREFTENHKLSSVSSWIGRKTTSAGEYYEGNVLTPHGFAYAYSELGAGKPVTCVMFIHKGRLHRLRREARYTVRGLTRVAARFVRQVVSQ